MDHALDAHDPRLAEENAKPSRRPAAERRGFVYGTASPVVGWAAAFRIRERLSELVDVEDEEVPGPAWGSPRSALSYASAEADGSTEEPSQTPGENKMKRAALWAQLVQIAWEQASRPLASYVSRLLL